MFNYLAYLIVSHKSAFNGTMTKIQVLLIFCKDAGYWNSKLLPKPVGRLATTSDVSKQFNIAFCIVFS